MFAAEDRELKLKGEDRFFFVVGQNVLLSNLEMFFFRAPTFQTETVHKPPTDQRFSSIMLIRGTKNILSIETKPSLRSTHNN